MKTSTEKPPDAASENPDPEEKKVDEDELRPWRKNMKKLEDLVPGELSFRKVDKKLGRPAFSSEISIGALSSYPCHRRL